MNLLDEYDVWYCWVCDTVYSDGFHDEEKHKKCLDNINFMRMNDETD